MTVSEPLTNLQQELLRLYSSNIKEEDLLFLKRLIAKYFADKATNEADDIWEKKGYSNETMKQWLEESNRPSDAK